MASARPEPDQTTYSLYIGKKFTGITVQPDPRWPSMWRIHQGDEVSDMVNLTRAKEAAITWARSSGLITGGSMAKGARWDMTKRPAEAATGALKRSEAVE